MTKKKNDKLNDDERALLEKYREHFMALQDVSRRPLITNIGDHIYSPTTPRNPFQIALDIVILENGLLVREAFEAPLPPEPEEPSTKRWLTFRE